MTATKTNKSNTITGYIVSVTENLEDQDTHSFFKNLPTSDDILYNAGNWGFLPEELYVFEIGRMGSIEVTAKITFSE